MTPLNGTPPYTLTVSHNVATSISLLRDTRLDCTDSPSSSQHYIFIPGHDGLESVFGKCESSTYVSCC
jgi:hypothetical protein